MSERKITAPPWGISEGSGNVYAVNCPGDGGDIVCEPPSGFDNSLKRWPANARLICAAPELLEALRDCADYFHDFTEQDEGETRLAAICRAAIAKATGQQPLEQRVQATIERVLGDEDEQC